MGGCEGSFKGPFKRDPQGFYKGIGFRDYLEVHGEL